MNGSLPARFFLHVPAQLDAAALGFSVPVRLSSVRLTDVTTGTVWRPSTPAPGAELLAASFLGQTKTLHTGAALKGKFSSVQATYGVSVCYMEKSWGVNTIRLQRIWDDIIATVLEDWDSNNMKSTWSGFMFELKEVIKSLLKSSIKSISDLCETHVSCDWDRKWSVPLLSGITFLQKWRKELTTKSLFFSTKVQFNIPNSIYLLKYKLKWTFRL